MHVIILIMLLFVPAKSEAKSYLDPSILDAAALLVFDTGGSGSGVYLSTGNTLYFITAKHVLYDEKGKLRGKQITLSNNNEISIDLNIAPVDTIISSSKGNNMHI